MFVIKQLLQFSGVQTKLLYFLIFVQSSTLIDHDTPLNIKILNDFRVYLISTQI